MPRSVRFRRRSSAALLVAATLAVAARADGTGPELGPRARAELAALGAWKAGRSAAERKIASTLLFALDRREGRLPALLAGIEALPLPEKGPVRIDLVAARGAPAAALAAAARRRGARLVAPPSGGGRELRVEMPVDRLRALAAEPAVARLLPARLAFTHAVRSEGDRTLEADLARDHYGLTGDGFKVCVLSDGVSSLDVSQLAGELPAVDVLSGEEGSGDEGTAMLEIVHDLAPGAALGFATAFGGFESFAANIQALAASGCRVIVDDVIYLVESPFQDLAIAAAVDAVAAQGVLYLSSAGNEGNLDDGTAGTWEGDFAAHGTVPPLPGLELNDFGDGGVSDLVLDYAPAVVLHWTDPFGASGNDYDLFVLDGTLSEVLRFSNDTQDGDGDPVEIVSFFGSGAEAGERLVVGRSAGADRLLNLIAFRGELELATPGALRGHAAAAGAIAVAAVPASVPYSGGGPPGPFPNPYDAGQQSELFSADGPRRIFFAADGTLLPGAPPGNFSSTGGVVRQKPDLTAPDGVATSVDGFRRFFGTSAAAPHAAALATLAWSARPEWSHVEVRQALAASALDIETPGFDRVTGTGIPQLIDALEAAGVPLAANLELASVATLPEVGNGDTALDPGERWRLRLGVENVGGAGAQQVRVTLAAESVGVEVLEPIVALGSLAPDALAEAGDFVVELAPVLACGEILHFSVRFDYAGGVAPQTVELALPVGSEGPTSVFPYLGAPVAIPDAPANGVPGATAFATIDVPALGGRVRDLDFSLDGALCSTDPEATTVGVQHGFIANLRLDLVAPSGRRLTLIRNTDGFGNNFCQTLLDDESDGASIQSVETPDNPFTGSYTPALPLAAFDGENPVGTWTLEVTDWLPHDLGTIRAFSLHLTPGLCRPFSTVVEVPALTGAGAVLLGLLLAGVALAMLARLSGRGQG